MIFLTFAAALAIELIGTYISVIGLTALFGANWVITAMAISLDMAKIVVVSIAYTHWKTLARLMRVYALIAVAITMIITSAGASAYLSGEFQKAIVGTQEGSVKVTVLKQEQAKLEARKKQIDDSIASLPEKYTANQRTRAINQFKDEQKQVTTRLTEIDKELPTLQVAQISTEAKAGPILYIAKAFDIPVEQAVKWVILMIIFVFDPLAVFLIIAGNFLLEQRRAAKKEEKQSDVQAIIPEREYLKVKDPEDELPANALQETQQVVEVKPLPTVILAGPDTSQTKVYTEQDLRDVDADQVILKAAGYPDAPIFEVLTPTPVVETPEEDDGAWKWTHEPHTHEEHELVKSQLDERRLELLEADAEQVDSREVITRSSLGLVDADPHTIVDTSANEVGYKTGVYRSGQSK